MIAKVDAEAPNAKATAQEQGVTSYPTIKFFPRGSTTGESYMGARTEQAFVDFLNEKTGSRRTVGGGLNDEAGTVNILDALVEKYTGDMETLGAELKAVVAGLKDSYAGYYVKVVSKLQENAEYASKELARLQKMASKNNVAPEKLDDLISRSNILRKFVAKKDGKDEL